MANGHSIDEGVFDKMKNAAGSNRSSDDASAEQGSGPQVSLSQAAELAKSHSAENAFTAKYGHPVSVPHYGDYPEGGAHIIDV